MYRNICAAALAMLVVFVTTTASHAITFSYDFTAKLVDQFGTGGGENYVLPPVRR